MAGVLEKQEKRSYLDDTTPLTATITTHRTEGGGKSSYTSYVIRVQRGPNTDDSWEVSHRYNDFFTLHQVLMNSGVQLSLPNRKVFGNTERQLLLERELGLQGFLEQVMAEPVLRRHIAVKKFLDPQNYSSKLHETALYTVSMFLQSEPTWSVDETLEDVGWRIRKQYYLITSKTNHKLPKHMLSWCEPGPDFSLGEREMEAALRVLADIRHPYILSPVLANHTGAGIMVVRLFIPTGSLKDAIYGQRPKLSVLQKYARSPVRSRLLSLPDIAKYGRQVLEALLYLSEKGFPYGHVHAGNVLLEKGNCKLVDIENSLIGVPFLYRSYLLDIRRLHSHEAVTVYSFGRMLYEMCMGQELKTPLLESVPTSLPDGVVPLLKRILTADGIKENFPSLSNILDDLFFSTVYLPPNDCKPLMKVSSRLKEVLKAHVDRADQRLYEDQKKVSQSKRASRVHDSLMSEEERKRRRKLRKKQLSLDQSSESQAYPTTTSLPRQNTIGTSGVSARRSKTATGPTNSPTPPQSSKTGKSASAAPKATPPPSSAPPKVENIANESNGSSKEHGALLSSISGFTKGKLKKTVTNDRSAPKV